MNHEELERKVTHRIDRLEDALYTRLDGIENRLDELVPSMIESTTRNRTKLDGMAGQIRLIWTVILAVVSAAGTYIANRLGLS